ncbi:T3SS effector HopA1 family protein [Nostoc sp.]|uniref:T3SS effector HopA1 family protein n=1 Tax=Nostoc sp. TaxID=1180 RepID=UPI002FF69D27
MQVIEILEEIVNYIQINPENFLINHHNHQLPELDSDLIIQLKKLPQEIQDKYFNSLLQEFIHNIYYDGSFVRKRNQFINTNYQIGLENKSFEVDWEFCERLHSNNKGKGSFHPNFRVVKEEVDGSLAVEYFGIIVHIERESHLRLQDRSATVGDIVAVSMPSNQLKLGYYTAIGDAVSLSDGLRVFIYFNFNPEGAVAFMKGLTTQLNTMQVFFTFLVDYNPDNYGRYYSGLVSFYSNDYKLAIQVIKSLYEENQSQFQHQVPIFNKVLAPGISLAEKPEFEFNFMENFGMNRCQIVANALLEAHKNGDESKEARMKYILQHFDYFKIDLERPYLNPDSEDIYTPLD